MTRRRAMMIQKAQQGGNLPSGYTAVNYLQSSGTQYIDIGLTLTQDSAVQFDIQITKADTGRIFGGRETAEKNNFSAYILKSPTRMYFDFGGSANRKFEDYSLARRTYYIDKDGVKRNGTKVLSFASAADFETPSAMLFNIGGAGDGAGVSARVYGFKVFKNDNLVADMRPYLDSDGKPCFYDMVRQKTYYNQGTGSFTWG